jgi:murein DD-endopeptidase MepM/ murein hydrolase activator NlpD
MHPFAMLASLLAMAPDHPEWGPPPPVAPFTHDYLPSDRVVTELVFPVIGKCRWRDDYNVDRDANRHTGIDIRAPKMCPIVAPISGVLGMKPQTFWIYSRDGWAVLGTHLNDDNLGTHDHAGDRDVMFAPGLVAGQYIQAGQFIGYVGESGDATAPHLHFELYVPGPGPSMDRIRDPYPSLKSARVLTHPIGLIPSPEDRPAEGQIRVEGCVRRVDADRKRLTLILAAKETPTGTVTAINQIRYLQLHLSDQEADSLGGWKAIADLPAWQTIGAYLPFRGGIVGTDPVRVTLGP